MLNSQLYSPYLASPRIIYFIFILIHLYPYFASILLIFISRQDTSIFEVQHTRLIFGHFIYLSC